MYVNDRNAPSTCPTAPAFLVMKSPYMFSHFGGSLTTTFVWSAACRSRSMGWGSSDVEVGVLHEGTHSAHATLRGMSHAAAGVLGALQAEGGTARCRDPIEDRSTTTTVLTCNDSVRSDHVSRRVCRVCRYKRTMRALNYQKEIKARVRTCTQLTTQPPFQTHRLDER